MPHVLCTGFSKTFGPFIQIITEGVIDKPTQQIYISSGKRSVSIRRLFSSVAVDPSCQFTSESFCYRSVLQNRYDDPNRFRGSKRRRKTKVHSSSFDVETLRLVALIFVGKARWYRWTWKKFPFFKCSLWTHIETRLLQCQSSFFDMLKTNLTFHAFTSGTLITRLSVVEICNCPFSVEKHIPFS